MPLRNSSLWIYTRSVFSILYCVIILLMLPFSNMAIRRALAGIFNNQKMSGRSIRVSSVGYIHPSEPSSSSSSSSSASYTRGYTNTASALFSTNDDYEMSPENRKYLNEQNEIALRQHLNRYKTDVSMELNKKPHQIYRRKV